MVLVYAYGGWMRVPIDSRVVILKDLYDSDNKVQLAWQGDQGVIIMHHDGAAVVKSDRNNLEFVVDTDEYKVI